MPKPSLWSKTLRAAFRQEYRPNASMATPAFRQLAQCPLPPTANGILAREILIAAIQAGAVDAVRLRHVADLPGTRWCLHLTRRLAPWNDQRDDGWRLLDEWQFTVELALNWKTSSALLMLYFDGAQPYDTYDGSCAVWRLGAL